MRIIAGRWRGRSLSAPAGSATRPTADRVRQAIFDRLLHAPWGGRTLIEDAAVLDGFAGTGALGLEALSRGAATAIFFERDRAALTALRSNIAACSAEARVVPGDILRPPPGSPCRLAFLDPPYAMGYPARAIAALRGAGWLMEGAILVLETGRDEPASACGDTLAEANHGAATIRFIRL